MRHETLLKSEFGDLDVFQDEGRFDVLFEFHSGAGEIALANKLTLEEMAKLGMRILQFAAQSAYDSKDYLEQVAEVVTLGPESVDHFEWNEEDMSNAEEG